ncbi:MAG: class I SAM-dependent methyltransferase [Bacteroidota bacterium]
MEFLENYPKQEKLFFLTPEKDQFEKAYLEVREKEGRIYPDEWVTQLPQLPPNHPQHQEWKLRQWNTDRLLQYFQQFKPRKVLDLGCGNGWLTHQLAAQDAVEVLGLDVNKLELQQASRLFASEHCHFAYGDIFVDVFPAQYFDAIVLDSCVQYFPDFDQLVNRLLALLQPRGRIHILDSPFYKTQGIAAARQRTNQYYQNTSSGAMVHHYFHHTWEDLQPYTYRLQYQPNALRARLRRKFMGQGSPFPWIVILPKK